MTMHSIGQLNEWNPFANICFIQSVLTVFWLFRFVSFLFLSIMSVLWLVFIRIVAEPLVHIVYLCVVLYTWTHSVAYVYSWQMQFRLYWCVRILVFSQWWWWWYFVFMSFRRTISDGRNSDATYKLNLDSFICVQAFS